MAPMAFEVASQPAMPIEDALLTLEELIRGIPSMPPTS